MNTLVKTNAIIYSISFFFFFNIHSANSQIIFDKLDTLYYKDKFPEIYTLFLQNQNKFSNNSVKKIYLIESLLNLKKYGEASILLKKDTTLSEIDKLDIVVNNIIKDDELNTALQKIYVENYCNKNSINKEIVVSVSRNFYKDQYIRAKNDIFNMDNGFYEEKETNLLLESLIKNKIFPSPSNVGEETTHRIMILVSHSENIEIQRSYLKKILINKDYPNSLYGQDKAILTDKILLEDLGVQLFGTQIEIINSNPIASKLLSPKLVNPLRKEIGLKFPLETYLNFFK